MSELTAITYPSERSSPTSFTRGIPRNPPARLFKARSTMMLALLCGVARIGEWIEALRGRLVPRRRYRPTGL